MNEALRYCCVFAIFLSGCVQTHRINQPEPEPVVEDVTPEPAPEPKPLEAPALSVSAPATMVASIHELFGDSGTITIKRPKPLVVDKGDTKLTFGTETTLDFTLTEDGGHLTFAQPMPVITARIWGPVKAQPWLKDIQLNADDSATVTAHSSVYGDKKRTFDLKWREEGSSSASDLPVVELFCIPNCPPCALAESQLNQLAADGKLPFQVIHATGRTKYPTAGGYPHLEWQGSSQPYYYPPANSNGGWPGAEAFIRIWQGTQSPPAAASSLKKSAPLDRSSIGSRSVAIWRIDGDNTPSRSTLLSHLLNDGIHRGRYTRQFLESLTTEQLRFLHDRDHGS